MPYLYSVVREGCQTGLPVMRALWIHYPDDAAAVARGRRIPLGPEYPGRPRDRSPRDHLSREQPEHLLAARANGTSSGQGSPTSRGRRFKRLVDLATHAALHSSRTSCPLGPVKQYTDEQVKGPLTLQVYPGADGQFLVYEDDGVSFAYRTGDWMGLDLRWEDQAKRLTIQLAEARAMRPPLERKLELRLIPDAPARTVAFTGKKLEITL